MNRVCALFARVLSGKAGGSGVTACAPEEKEEAKQFARALRVVALWSRARIEIIKFG